MNSMVALMLMLPFNLAKFGFNQLSEKMSMCYSNMPLPKERYNFGGVRVNSVIGFLPAVGDMQCGMFCASHGNTM